MQPNQQTLENYSKAMGKLIAQAWQDPSFVQKLKANPHAVLESFGLDIPTTAKLDVIVSQPNDFYIVLPPQLEQALSDEHLAAVAGGGSSASSAGSAGTAGCPVSSASSAGSAGSEGG